MTDELWREWALANDFILTRPNCAERAWSHADGYGFVTLRFVWGRDDGKADTVVSGTNGKGPVNIAVSTLVDAKLLIDFFEAQEYKLDASPTVA